MWRQLMYLLRRRDDHGRGDSKHSYSENRRFRTWAQIAYILLRCRAKHFRVHLTTREGCAGRAAGPPCSPISGATANRQDSNHRARKSVLTAPQPLQLMCLAGAPRQAVLRRAHSWLHGQTGHRSFLVDRGHLWRTAVRLLTTDQRIVHGQRLHEAGASRTGALGHPAPR